MTPIAATARTYQAGLESSNGTAVAATAKLAVGRIRFSPTDNVNRPRLAKNQALRSPGNEFPSIRGTAYTVQAFEWNYEQAPFWLGRAIQGGQSAVGESAPYTWTHTRTGLVAPALKAATLERRDTDFSNHIDHEFPYCMPQQIHVGGNRDGNIMYDEQGVACRRADSTLTASLQAPTPVNIPFARSRVYLNDSWATLGNTQLTGKVVGWDFTFFTGVKLLRTAENNADLDYDIDVIDGNEVGWEIKLRLLADKTLFDAELAKAESQALRAVRIKMDGANSRAQTIDALAKYVGGSLELPVDEVEGQRVYEIVLQEASDDTNGMQWVVANTSDVALGWEAS